MGDSNFKVKEVEIKSEQLKLNMFTDFYSDQLLSDSFFSLQKCVFPEIDLKWALQNGFIPQTIPWGIFKDKKALSILNATQMKIMLNGEIKRAIQIGTVATDPNFRHLGLSRKLFTHVLKKYSDKYDFIFLFANNTVLDFYPKFDFQQQPESLFRMKLQNNREKHLFRKLSPDSIDILKKVYSNQDVLSNTFSVLDHSMLSLWYCKIVHHDCLWYDESSQTIMVAKAIDSTLHVFDIVSQRNDSFFFENLFWPHVKDVVVHFVPDRFNGLFIPELDPEEDVLFYRGGVTLADPYIKVPELAHT